MPEPTGNVCGTGGWAGPLPGDPDNNITVSATVSYGGITVSWTLPLTNPQAVAHYRIYRGLTADPAMATLLAVSGGNQYFDQTKVTNPPRYYYWVEILSVHGTVGDKVGPASAQAAGTIAELLERLTGQIDSGLLATSLRNELDTIQTLNTSLIAEVANRINDNGVLAGIVADVQAEVATALTYIYNETTSRIDADSAALDSYNVLAAAVGSSLASFVSEISLLASDVAANATAITDLTVSLGDDIATVATTAQANIDALTGEVNALYTAKLTVNGLVGGFGLANDGLEVEAGFDVDTFWVGRTSGDKVKPFIISDGVVYIDSAMVSTLAADQIDTRNLTIKDSLGNVIFGASENLDWTRIAGTNKPADGATRNVFRGDWASGTLYPAGDIVIEAGYGWSSIASHTSSALVRPPVYPVTSNAYWTIYTVKGDTGLPGANGTRTAILDMYKNSVAAPTTFPSGSSTYTWATGLFTAPGTPNGWDLVPPAPVVGQDLYVVRQLYSDNNTTSTSTVGWAATTSRVSAASGEPGTDGVNGARVGFLEVYQWAASAPTVFPSGTSTYTWATGSFTAPSTPAGWALLPGAHVAGQTLWACSMRVANNSTVTTDSVTWSTSTAYAVGASGANGANPLTVVVSNEAHVLPATSAGVVSSYAGSGTQIRVYEGATELAYDGVGTAAGTWAVSSAVSNIVRGTLTDSGAYLTVGDHSGVADGVDASSITYTITGKNSANASFSLVKTQTFSKSKAGATGSTGSAGPAVVVTSDRPATFTATDGTLDGAQANLVLTAVTQGLTGPTFAWTFSGLQTNPTASTTASQTITAAQFGTAKSAIVTCTVNGSLVDKVTIVRLEKSTAAPGAASSTVFLKSAGMTLEANRATKTAVSPFWDQHVYSKDGYAGGAYAIGSPQQTNAAIMFGLAADPVTSVNYNQIDYALYMTNFGTLQIFRLGVAGASLGSYVAGDVLAVTYDGSTVRWLKNGVVLATEVVSNTAPLFFDSSYFQPGYFNGLQFGPYGNPSAVQPSNPITAGNASTYIANAAIGNAQIGGVIQSDDFVTGVSGWRILKSGTVEFGSGVFRGNLVGASGSFSGTLSASNVVTTTNIVGGAISDIKSSSGTGGTISTTLTIPPNLTMKIVGMGFVNSVSSAGPGFTNTTLSINGTTTVVSAVVVSGETGGGPEGGGTVFYTTSPMSVMNSLDVTAGPGGLTVTISLTKSSGTGGTVVAIGTLR